MTTYLTPHFSLEELCATQHRGVRNTPSELVIDNLQDTAKRMEKVRYALDDNVITVSSGYRSPALNRLVGGVSKSAHLTGHAVDFNCFRFGTPLEVCRAIANASIPFDQLIEEGTWVHISFAPAMRGEILTKRAKGGYQKGLRK